MYALTADLGIRVTPGMSLVQPASRLTDDTVAIVLFRAVAGESWGHFSPVLAGTPMQFPNEVGDFSLDEIEALRQSPGLFRPCVIASGAPAT